MKKIVLLLILASTFLSCNENKIKSLEYSVYGNYRFRAFRYTYTFTTKNSGVYEIWKDYYNHELYNENSQIKFTYELKYPNLTIYFDTSTVDCVFLNQDTLFTDKVELYTRIY